jgi:hypothetical protein
VQRTLAERLIRLYVLAPSGCWEWLGYRGNKGYGQVRVNGTTMQAHRVSYKLFVDPDLPDELLVDHLCRNHGCGNPLHLAEVSNEENQERGMTKTARGRAAQASGRCGKGHDLTKTGRKRGNGYVRCIECHREAEKRRRARKKQEVTS